ncbi:MAG: hypothetical protein RL153_2254, partial [Verrucomicrobiota bacterium]
MAKAAKKPAAKPAASTLTDVANLIAFSALTPTGADYVVRDIGLAEWGRKE